ncbi:hypothetical protein POSPLADRAFT_1037912 [Postia placenta MAD-698-R-SB12]|uniref:Uncharacterized protein n=1 Tax=Postia placenta MAD-698-R-SB12 TaxID=670580 RepID=A0A1X6NF35_9APHY|nr:hypothetical protein POSPLADRAFT_1037912 [Postia placenta MAD-698-R-SB12]OSX67238.1 hypothetical protein POSPLADRAFT_1037912 [Postia placenta MAD-698-R-SB12]
METAPRTYMCAARREAHNATSLQARLEACPSNSNDRGGRRSGTQRRQGSCVHRSMCPRCLLHRRPASSASRRLDVTWREGELTRGRSPVAYLI